MSLLPRITLGLYVIGALLLLGAQGIHMIAKDDEETSAPRTQTVVIRPIKVEVVEAKEVDTHDHDSELKEASKSAAARRRLYGRTTSASSVPVVTVPKAPTVQKLLPVVDQKDIKEHHRILADATLRAIDPGCRNQLKSFYVRYDNPENRGLGGGSTIIITGSATDDEFRALLVHECGHVIDTGAWKGTKKGGVTNFSDGNEPVYLDDPSYAFYSISWDRADKKKKGVTDADFVSGYAAWNAFEDFAETFAYYTLHREEFEARAQTNTALMAKYRFMETHISSGKPAATTHIWNGNIPWDVTKLPYSWNAVTAAVK